VSVYLSSLHDEIHLKEALARRGLALAVRFEDADVFLVCCRGSDWNEREWASAVDHLRAQSHPPSSIVALQLTAAPLSPLLADVPVIALYPHWTNGVDAIAALAGARSSGPPSLYSVEANGIYTRRATLKSDGTPGTYTVKSNGPMVVDDELRCLLEQTVRTTAGDEK